MKTLARLQIIIVANSQRAQTKEHRRRNRSSYIYRMQKLFDPNFFWIEKNFPCENRHILAPNREFWVL
jgi:hypothetical protein